MNSVSGLKIKISKAGPCQNIQARLGLSPITISLESLTRLLNEKSSVLGEASSILLSL